VRKVITIVLCLVLCHSCSMSQKRQVPAEKTTPRPLSAEEEFAQRAREHKRRWEMLVRQAQYETLRSGLVNRYVTSVPEVTVKSLSSKLAKEFELGTAVLFYHVGDDMLRVWLIDRDGLRAEHQTRLSGAELDAAVSDLRDSLGVRALQGRRMPLALRAKPIEGTIGAGGRTLDEFVGNLTARLLPPPIAAPLGSVRHLIVVPARGIGAVPFVLLTPLGPGKPLVELMSVTIAPSLYDIMANQGKWDGMIRKALIVGNPKLPSEWADLPAAEREAAAVARQWGIKRYLTGREATREIVVRLAREKRLDLLYFATHGVANSDDPMEGGFIVLAGENGVEARWTAREIQKRGMPVKLVVLSACQTGLGKELDAGISGLARAFQLAGSPRVVMSLWSVYDDSTAELMSDFVSHLRSHPPAEALRLSMLELRKKRPNPVHWAAFSLFGTPL
jgi:CHAT domain